MTPTLFLSLKREVHALHCLGSPPRRKNNLPSCVPGVSQIPAFTLSMPRLSVCLAVQCTCVLSQAGWVSFKALNLWWSVAALRLMPVCPRRGVAPKCRGMEFGGKLSKEPVFRLATLSRCLCTHVEWGGDGNGTGSFVPRETMPPLPDASKKGEPSLPLCPREILRSHPLLVSYLNSFSTRALQHPLPQTSKTPVFELHCL